MKAKVLTIAILWSSILFSVYAIENIFIKSILIVMSAFWSVLILRMKTLKEQD